MCESNIATAALLDKGFTLVPASEIPCWPQTSGRQWYTRDNIDDTRNSVGLDYNFGGGMSVQLVRRSWIPDSPRLWDVAPSEFGSTYRARLTEMLLFQDDFGRDIANDAFQKFVEFLNGTISDWLASTITKSECEWLRCGIQFVNLELDFLIADARKRWEFAATSVSIQWQDFFARSTLR